MKILLYAILVVLCWPIALIIGVLWFIGLMLNLMFGATALMAGSSVAMAKLFGTVMLGELGGGSTAPTSGQWSPKNASQYVPPAPSRRAPEPVRSSGPVFTK